MNQLMPETQGLLRTISKFPPTPPNALTSEITDETLKQVYKTIPEKCSSSPSGRHVGHDKAIINSDTLLPLFTKWFK
jgi:hypothetical protein